jgi:hypothetical protein
VAAVRGLEHCDRDDEDELRLAAGLERLDVAVVVLLDAHIVVVEVTGDLELEPGTLRPAREELGGRRSAAGRLVVEVLERSARVDRSRCGRCLGCVLGLCLGLGLGRSVLRGLRRVVAGRLRRIVTIWLLGLYGVVHRCYLPVVSS